MTILTSDSGDGGAADTSIAGRTLDKALGGSGSLSWADTGDNIKTNGSNGFTASGDAASALVSMGASINAKARIAFTMSAACNLCVIGRKADASAAMDDAALLAILAGTTSLRIREYTSGTDHQNLTISAISTGTQYWLELEVNGTTITARVLTAALAVRNSVSHTLASPPAGFYWGFGYFFGGVTATLDSFVIEDVAAAAAGGRQRGSKCH